MLNRESSSLELLPFERELVKQSDLSPVEVREFTIKLIEYYGDKIVEGWLPAVVRENPDGTYDVEAVRFLIDNGF